MHQHSGIEDDRHAHVMHRFACGHVFAAHQRFEWLGLAIDHRRLDFVKSIAAEVTAHVDAPVVQLLAGDGRVGHIVN